MFFKFLVSKLCAISLDFFLIAIRFFFIVFGIMIFQIVVLFFFQWFELKHKLVIIQTILVLETCSKSQNYLKIFVFPNLVLKITTYCY